MLLQPDLFNEVLTKKTTLIERLDTPMSQAVSPEIIMAITLHYLATGKLINFLVAWCPVTLLLKDTQTVSKQRPPFILVLKRSAVKVTGQGYRVLCFLIITPKLHVCITPKDPSGLGHSDCHSS